MSAALALIWAAPGSREHGIPPGETLKRKGNGHPAPSTILVVEDEVLIRLPVADYLRDCGYRVLEASTAEEAQAILGAGEPIEVLFSDIDLGPGMNGFMLASWARRTYPNIRIVLTSGVTRMAQEAGDLCDGPFVQKPYAYSTLAEHIRRLLAAFGRQTG